MLLVLAGCSAVRLGYDNGPTLAWWWLDGYLDVPGEQVPRAKAAIREWFSWHRSTQLPDYAALLADAQAEVMAPTTPERVCRWTEQVRNRAWTAVEQGLPLAASLLPALGPAQWRHLGQRYEKANAEMREDFLQPDPAMRQKASVERAVERAESVYGRLDDAQRRLLAEGIAASPFDPQAWLAERERRQRDVLRTLPALAAERAGEPAVLGALRRLAAETLRSPDSAYRSYQEALTSYNCALGARLHNSTTPAQRERARAKLRGWRDDFRALAGTPLAVASP